MKIKGVLLSGFSGDKKDGSGKFLSIDVLFDTTSLQKAKVHKLFAGSDYVGTYDLSNYKVFDEIEVEYTQEFGSQYIKLVDIKKVK